MTVSIDGKRVHIIEHGSGGPLIFWGVSAERTESVDKTAEALSGLVGKAPFTIAAFESCDWNGDFSPWPSPPVLGDEAFSGGGRKTLDWLCKSALPWTCENLSCGGKYIGGYSLAGLFSLWALYECEELDGAVSCSGSLWFPGWVEYAGAHAGQIKGDVYLSLGIKEERTRNRAMASVGDNTRLEFELLKSGENVRRCTLEWNPGGHFADIAGRMARGFQWITDN